MACFPTNVYLDNLQKFEISIGCDSIQCYPKSKSLRLKQINTPLSDEVKALFKNAEEASLSCLTERSMDAIDLSGSNGLKSLVVSACNEMDSLLTRSDQLPVVFADLEELHIKHMGYLSFIFAHSLPPPSLHKLRILKVQFCRQLVFKLLDFTLILLLQNLEVVAVENCKGLVNIFRLPKVCNEEHVLFSTLTKLWLVRLPDLRLIWTIGSSRLVINLNNLKVVAIKSCRLKYVFPFSVAQSLVKLETLDIKWCDNIERIVAEAEAGESTDHTQPFGFPSLKVVHIEGCRRLMSLFSVFTDEEVSLPTLKSLKLTNLLSLERLFYGSISVDLPLLEELVIEQCNLMGNFAADPSSCGLKSAPKLIKLQVDGQTFDSQAARDICRGK